MYNIVTDIAKLKVPCTPASQEEGAKIGARLVAALEYHANGIGLAANQIGINKRVCVINVKKPIILINPEIVSAYDKVQFRENCLSFIDEEVITERFRNILVTADNYQGSLTFYGLDPLSLLESVCVQHEIDHLDGMTMHDRTISLEGTRK